MMEPEGVAVPLDGKRVAREIVAGIRSEVAALPRPPELAFVMVGSDPASASYVRSKERLAARAGLRSRTVALGEGVRSSELLAAIGDLNADPGVDGVLVQLPLPAHLSVSAAIEAIDPAKDVDGLHPLNVGRLWSGGAGLVPATPLGILALLDAYGIGVAGREAVVVGRSQLVGRPAAALLLQRDATVTLAHSRTPDLGAVTRRADILVVAAGQPGLVDVGMVKRGAAVLDVGLSRVDGKIRGDVDGGVSRVAGYLTPMPGGTGPMTVAMVIRNTLLAARRRLEP